MDKNVKMFKDDVTKDVPENLVPFYVNLGWKKLETKLRKLNGLLSEKE